MAISRAKKEELVAQYKELIGQSNALFLTDYTGMDVKAMESLRDKVSEVNGSFHVTKNSLLQIALQESKKTFPPDLLGGQIATGFALEEIPTLAKVLVDYAKDEDTLKIKGGILESEFLTVEQVENLAKLPSLEELRAQLLGLINAPARNIVSTITSSVRQVVNVIDAYAKSEESSESEESAEAEND